MTNRSGEFSKATMTKVFKLSGGFCQHCGDKITFNTCRFHHRVPLYLLNDVSDDIKSSAGNCVVLCIDCHDSSAGYKLFHGIHANPKLAFQANRRRSRIRRDIHFSNIEAFTRIINMLDNIYDLTKLMEG